MTNEEIAKRLSKVVERVWSDGAYQNFIRLDNAQDFAEEMRDGLQATIDEQAFQLAEKDAKIYAYEAIIANSNFKAILPRAKGGGK